MDVPVPVNLYDVVTTADPPRIVVTCRNAQAQHELAVKLEQLRLAGALEGGEEFTSAPPRVVTLTLPLDPSTQVSAGPYDVAVEPVAQALIKAAG